MDLFMFPELLDMV